MPEGVPMVRMPRVLRTLAVSAGAAALLALAALGMAPAGAQASGYRAEITKIETDEQRVTLKASMGQQSLRVAPGVVLDAFKPGDKVLVTFGQDGAESIIIRIELIKP
jgi:Cu/Ag efflux protein CusF